MNPCIRRLQQELKNRDLNRNDIIYVPLEDNIKIWNATVTGPVGSAFENYKLKLRIVFPDDYPFKPPRINFINMVYHPNTNLEGDICLDILKCNWSPVLTIEKVLLSIISLLDKPNTSDPLNSEAARLYDANYEKYKMRVIEYLLKNKKK